VLFRLGSDILSKCCPCYESGVQFWFLVATPHTSCTSSSVLNYLFGPDEIMMKALNVFFGLIKISFRLHVRARSPHLWFEGVTSYRKLLLHHCRLGRPWKESFRKNTCFDRTLGPVNQCRSYSVRCFNWNGVNCYHL
jgi:hypothetical protein